MDVDATSLTRGRKLAPSEYSALYSLLGRFLLLEIDPESLVLLRDPGVASVLASLEPDFRADVERQWSAADFDEAAAEYCSLFVLPGGVTLHAAYWMPGDTEEMGHHLAAALDQLLETFGLDIGATPMGQVPKGHIGLLLALAGHLYGADHPDAARHGRDFVQNFIASWVAPFTQALAARAKSPIYRALALLLAELHDFG